MEMNGMYSEDYAIEELSAEIGTSLEEKAIVSIKQYKTAS